MKLRKKFVVGFAALIILIVPVAASAHPARTKVNIYGCRMGAHAFEHWTKARHVGWDDNGRCHSIRVLGVRDCTNGRRQFDTGFVAVNRVDKSNWSCDAVTTHTWGSNADGEKFDWWTAAVSA